MPWPQQVLLPHAVRQPAEAAATHTNIRHPLTPDYLAEQALIEVSRLQRVDPVALAALIQTIEPSHHVTTEGNHGSDEV